MALSGAVSHRFNFKFKDAVLVETLKLTEFERESFSFAEFIYQTRRFLKELLMALTVMKMINGKDVRYL